MSDVDTSAEAVTAAAEWIERNACEGGRYHDAAATLRALLAERDELRAALQKIVDQSCETFHINPEGGKNIRVEGQDRFAFEQDVIALVTIAREALKRKENDQ